jgi:hypothetical protein
MLITPQILYVKGIENKRHNDNVFAPERRLQYIPSQREFPGTPHAAL